MSWWQDILFALYILIGVLFACAIVAAAVVEFGQWRIARKIVWLKTECPVCHETYEYPKGGYKPSTCGKFDCLYHWGHKPKFKTEVKS